eukprot:551206-Prorocentrum_minimum.AAC.1
MSTLEGYNATIIAYGPTGTGKTYTMEGGREGDTRGIIPRAIDDIFDYIENDTSASRKYLVRAAYLQIYNEVISDLLKPERTNLTIREEKRRGIFVEGLSEWVQPHHPGGEAEGDLRGPGAVDGGDLRSDAARSGAAGGGVDQA